jgi:hypothetical protein
MSPFDPRVEQVTVRDGFIEVAADVAHAAAINLELVRAGVAVSELSAHTASLEDVFLELTANGGRP